MKCSPDFAQTSTMTLPILLLGALLLLIMPITSPAQNLSRILVGPPVDATGSSRAVNWVDADDDGDLDLYVTNGGSVGEHNEYYRNDAGSLVQILGTTITLDGLRADGSSWGDYDNDGDKDLFVVSWYGETNAMFENQGGGVFTSVASGPHVTTGTFSEGCAWVDYDSDGDLDLYITNSGSGASMDNLLYRNEGGGTFVEITGEPIVNDAKLSRGPAWADFDADGDVDLFLPNESSQNNSLYRNELVETGTATFTALSAGAITSDGGNSWSSSWGDYDNDNDLDLVVANQNGGENFLYRNEMTETGSADFSRILDQQPAIDRGWLAGTHWADWDNDGDLDLMMTGGYALIPTKLRKCIYYRNDDGDLNRNITIPAALDEAWSYGASWGDYDGDGDLDLCTANWHDVGESNYFYRNEAQANGNHWLTIECEGTESNRSGIGCRIRVVASIWGESVSQLREIFGADGYCSQNLRAHFGMGDATAADSIIVSWPSGTEQVLTGVSIDQYMVIVEPTVSVGVLDGADRPVPDGVSYLGFAQPNPFRGTTAVHYAIPSPATVRLQVYDLSGRLVRELRAGPQTGGNHQVNWDGRDRSGTNVASGVYYFRLEVNGVAMDSRKVVLTR